MLSTLLPRSVWMRAADAFEWTSYKLLRLRYRLHVLSLRMAGRFGWSWGVKNLSRVYDPSADGHVQLSEALRRAKSESKRVLIQWGGNWCPSCWQLRDLFECHDEIHKVVAAEYVLTFIDFESNQVLLEELGTEPNAVPYLTILDADGKKIADQVADKFVEDDDYQPADVLAVLMQWKTPRDDAAQ